MQSDSSTNAIVAGAYPEPYSGVTPDNHARTMGMLVHLLALCGLVGVPFGNILGPLILWLVKRNEIPFVDDQGKESINFQITTLIAAVVISPTVCLAGIGIVLLIALLIASLVYSIIAAIQANQGIAYRYPYTLRLVK